MPTDRKNPFGKTTQPVDMGLEENDLKTFKAYQGRPPLAVSFKTAGSLIDRSSRTIKRMVDRGDLDDLPGYNLVTYASLESWVKRCRRSNNPPNPASTFSGAREP